MSYKFFVLPEILVFSADATEACLSGALVVSLNLQAAASAADLQIILCIGNLCVQTDLFCYNLVDLEDRRKGNILSQRDGSDGACRRFRFRNGFANADQIKTK